MAVMSKIECRKGCDRRHERCHGSCPDYILEKAIYNANAAEKRKQYEVDMGVKDQRHDAIRRITKRMDCSKTKGSKNG